MDRISSTTKAGVFVEAMHRIDNFENNRIALYKGLKTANRITIIYDFNTNLVSITAILPIDSVDISKPEGSIDYVNFSSNYLVSIPSHLFADISEAPNNLSGDELLSVTLSAIGYVSAFSIGSADALKPEPKKNIQITLDEPNLKAIIDAVIPFSSYLNDSGAIMAMPLDE